VKVCISPLPFFRTRRKPSPPLAVHEAFNPNERLFMRKGKGEDTIRQVRRKATNSLAATTIVINSSKGRKQHQKEGN
jgi:hypothetical protein